MQLLLLPCFSSLGHRSPMPHPACRCLQDAAQESPATFSEGCRAEVASYEARATSDYRLDARLAAACSADVQRLCPPDDLCGALARECGCSAVAAIDISAAAG